MDTIDRRQFIAIATGALGALATSANAQESTPIPIKVAVITHAGGAHLSIYFTALAAISEVASVVLSDPDGACVEDARTRLGSKLTKVYTDRGEMLAAEKPTMAVVSYEAKLAPVEIDAALDAGCHVLAEKPACVHPDAFAPLVAKAENKGLHLMLALANRVNPEVREAKRAIADGKLGKVYGLEMNLIQDQTRLTSPDYQRTWYADKARAGGGHLAWLGIHWLDLATYITASQIQDVTGYMGNVGGQPIDIEDSVAMAMRFDNGTFGTLTSGYYRDKGSESHMKIWGSKGWLQIDSGDPQTMKLYSTVEGAPQEVVTFNRPAGFDPYIDFFREAVRASIGAGPAPITGQESLRVLRVVHGLYDAAGSGTHKAMPSL